ncbi:hypothetical protein GCM10018965_021000 [Nonomuraea roseola]
MVTAWERRSRGALAAHVAGLFEVVADADHDAAVDAQLLAERPLRAGADGARPPSSIASSLQAACPCSVWVEILNSLA